MTHPHPLPPSGREWCGYVTGSEGEEQDVRGVGYIVPPIAVQKFEREKIIEALKDAAVETLGLPGDTVVASIRFCCTSQSWLVIYTHDSFPDVEAVVYQPVSI